MVSGLNMPNMGSNIPNMGMKIKTVRAKARKSLVDALFSATQQKVLGMLFGQPDRSFYATELINILGVGSGAVQRELARLAESGLVTVRKIGTQKHYQADPKSPVYHELCGIILKTVGLAEPLRNTLLPFAERIRAAFIYGSVAQGTDTARSDIDLMLICENLSYAEVFEALQTAETSLGRPVNPTLYSPAEWAKKCKTENGFAAKVAKRPKLFLFGSDQNLT